MKKIMYITPHLSTGGLPQYLCKKIETFKDQYEIYCIEWNDVTGGRLVVQRNKIKELLGDNLITLYEDKNKIFEYIDEINPDFIHFEEIPETFIDYSILDKIYFEDRKYSILSTTHSMYTEFNNIRYTADKFVLVSEWSKNKFQSQLTNIPCEVWEYPVEKQSYDKDKAKQELNWDPEYKHVLHVGLFTPGKNQSYIIDIAKLLTDYKIKFHFVGNQAENFKEYWEPLMQNLPSNCVWHDEQSDVEKYYKAADLFFFPSKFELNPISIKETLSYNLPLFLTRLETYQDTYDDIATYITNNLNEDKKLLLKHFNLKEIEIDRTDSVVLILGHCNTPYRKKLLKECINNVKNYTTVFCSNYPVEEEVQSLVDYTLFTKENPLLLKEEYSKYNITHNYWWIDNNGVRHEKLFDYEHGYAAYTLIKKGIEFCKGLGKKKVHVVNYDYIINNNTLDKNNLLLNEYDLISYKYKNKTYTEKSYGTGFFSAKIEALDLFCNHYSSKEQYYSSEEYFVFEVRFYNIYQNTKYKIYNEWFEDLDLNGNITNREGVLEFSKSKHIENEFQLIGLETETDKVILHEYHKFYPTYLDKFKNQEFNLFEIGIEFSKSYKLWEKYFPKARIYGLDIGTSFKTSRGEVFQGDQSNIGTLQEVTSKIGKCKIIIDDGSHIAEHQLKGFHYLFENMLDYGGVYVIEDIECSYWNPNHTIYGYETGHLNIVDYFSKLTHHVNNHYSKHLNPLHIKSISFAANCIVITKKEEKELQPRGEYLFKQHLW